MQRFLKGHSNARYSPAAIMSIIAYLEWEASCGKALDQKAGESDGTPEELTNIDTTLSNLQCNDEGIRGGLNRRQMYLKMGLVFTDTLSGELNEDIDDDAKKIDLNDTVDYTISGGGHGALFHLAQIARFQIEHRAGPGEPIKAIEGFRRIWLYSDLEKRFDAEDEESQDDAKKNKQIFDAYSRQVDIVLGKEGEPERWIRTEIVFTA